MKNEQGALRKGGFNACPQNKFCHAHILEQPQHQESGHWESPCLQRTLGKIGNFVNFKDSAASLTGRNRAQLYKIMQIS